MRFSETRVPKVIFGRFPPRAAAWGIQEQLICRNPFVQKSSHVFGKVSIKFVSWRRKGEAEKSEVPHPLSSCIFVSVPFCPVPLTGRITSNLPLHHLSSIDSFLPITTSLPNTRQSLATDPTTGNTFMRHPSYGVWRVHLIRPPTFFVSHIGTKTRWTVGVGRLTSRPTRMFIPEARMACWGWDSAASRRRQEQ